MKPASSLPIGMTQRLQGFGSAQGTYMISIQNLEVAASSLHLAISLGGPASEHPIRLDFEL